ncbi:hypothetical protein GCM10023191_028020 [Actinoallomurus oryzae]|jgi:hypothetical protein|uniref:Uncharacterized protein n=1 Tax=Actinoallomurus oryzae TaxID=502180 RepID=A0ABP8PS33_9ACTN
MLVMPTFAGAHEIAALRARPSWAGVIGFRTRFPGGESVEEFQVRGR